ncbi:hypothetical protein COV22_01705, partial [Candidatus Woesearchaeota archaeon CG10_big_fil_rev_8_21_14_0_10_47_5]
MKSIYIYSNTVGCFLLDSSFKLVGSAFFRESELVERNRRLSSGGWVKEELQLIEQNKGRSIVFIGFKSEASEGVKLGSSQGIYERISSTLGKLPGIRPGICKAARTVCSDALRHSVGADNLITQAVGAIDDVERSANLLSKRLREWYGLYCPEASNAIADHKRFAELAASRDRPRLLSDLKLPAYSMGADLAKRDVEEIKHLASEIGELYTLRDKHEKYLGVIMKELAPNISVLAGPLIGARLISIAGSLRHLAELPASTIQLLGAEKALFRHIRSGARPPKFGV